MKVVRLDIVLAWLLLAMLGVAAGCDSGHHVASYAYEVTVTLGDSLRQCDTATLHVVDDDYGAQRVFGSRRSADGSWVFAGQTTGQHVAFVTFDTLATPFYFVLEPAKIAITIERDRWSVAGGRGNAAYVRFASLRTRLLKERQRTIDNYRKAAADSTLTLRGERQAAVADSLLADSLQRLLLHTMQRTDAVGRIARERFIGTLSPESLQRLH